MKESYRANKLEMATRVNLYRDHLASINWETLWRLEAFQGLELAGFSAVMQGVKPAWIPEDLDTAKKLFELVPEAMTEVVLTKNGWIVDLGLIRRVLRKYERHFQDFDYKKLNDNEYLVAYLGARTTLTGVKVPNDEIIKVGLLLGYPYQSVIGHDEEHNVSFNNYGFMFSCSPQDLDSFLNFLRSAFESCGMKKLKAMVREKIRTGFAEMLSEYDGGIEVLEIDGRRYLEVVVVEKDDGIVSRQLLLWQDRIATKNDCRALLNAFSDRYGARALSYKDNLLGFDHPRYAKLLSEALPSQLPYMIMTESADKVMFQPAIIERKALEDYIKKTLG